MGVARELFVTDNFDRADVCGFPIRITAVENGGGGAFCNRLHVTARKRVSVLSDLLY